MGKRRVPEFAGIVHDRKITEDTDYEFLHHLENALLLALREQEILTPMEYRYAAQKLLQQCTDRAIRIMERRSE